MKRKIWIICAGLTVSAGITWGGILDTNASDFSNLVDWCAQGANGYSCSNRPPDQIFNPTAWTAQNGDTGEVGLDFNGQASSDAAEVRQQGLTWGVTAGLGGDFATGMGLIYNGFSTLGNTRDSIAIGFDQAEQGFGAYFDPAASSGTFTAILTLFDINDVALQSYSVVVTPSDTPGTAIFLGAYDATANVWGAVFSERSGDATVNNFAIGEAGIYVPVTTPEPVTLLLMGPALLGLAAFGRKRISKLGRNN